MSYTLGLPSGMEVQFRTPRNKDRKYVIENFIADNKNKGSSDIELLAAVCLETVNGAAPGDPDPRRRMDQWDLKDMQFYQGVFLEMFTISGEDELDKIKDTAKKLLEGGTANSKE